MYESSEQVPSTERLRLQKYRRRFPVVVNARRIPECYKNLKFNYDIRYYDDQKCSVQAYKEERERERDEKIIKLCEEYGLVRREQLCEVCLAALLVVRSVR